MKTYREIYNCVIVGAGASGLMAAVRAGELADKVLLLERNEGIGLKLLISGKGRCNLTNTAELEDFLGHFSRTADFLRSAFNKFFNRDLIYFFENNGLELKEERGARVFPVSDKSVSVVNVLKKCINKNAVHIRYDARVAGIRVNNDNIKEIILVNGEVIRSKSVILATGGLSYPLTGSSGDGFDIAKDLGHTIVALKAGLVGFETKENFVKHLTGLSLKNVQIKITCDNKKFESGVGEMLFTHVGVSGPLVLDLSAKIIDSLSINKSVKISIDLKPGLIEEQLDARLQRDFRERGSTIYKNLLKELLPGKLVGVFAQVSKIDINKPANQISKEERSIIKSLLKDFSLTIKRPRPIQEAIITRGGISTKEIDPKTMESRIVRGVYFCGEIIDIDADTGGFNLQAAFSTGYLAGESAALSLK